MVGPTASFTKKISDPIRSSSFKAWSDIIRIRHGNLPTMIGRKRRSHRILIPLHRNRFVPYLDMPKFENRCACRPVHCFFAISAVTLSLFSFSGCSTTKTGTNRPRRNLIEPIPITTERFHGMNLMYTS